MVWFSVYRGVVYLGAVLAVNEISAASKAAFQFGLPVFLISVVRD